jgi:hypothetical protein
MYDDVQLTPEDVAIFQQFFERRLIEAGGNGDTEDLEIARDILMAAINDGLTPTADGGFSHLRPGATDWTDPATIEATQVATGKGKRRLPAAGGQSRRRDMLQGLAMFAVAIIALAWFFWPSKDGQGEKVMTPIVEAEAAALGDVTPTPLPTLEAELLADIVDSAGVKTDLVVPRTLEVKGVSFVVQPVRITSGDWPLPDDERAVSWVFGTVVNYVMGVEASPQNKELLASLKLGDELLLRMSTGSAYRFAFLDAMRVAPQASEVFRQNRPGLTLTLLGDEEQAARVIVRATYIPDSELSHGGPTTGQVNMVAIGQTAPLDTLYLTVRAVQPVALPETPPGHVYLTVDYEVENSGEDLPLITGSFVHRLEGAGGLTFPLAPVTTSGPAIPPVIDAGEGVTATAMYVIPESALGEELLWQFAPVASGPAAQVKVPPYSGSLAAMVSVDGATLQAGHLAVTFTVQATLREVQITPADIMAEGATLDPVVNAFPWQVGAGQTGRFTLVVSPQANPVRLGMLAQGFEISY